MAASSVLSPSREQPPDCLLSLLAQKERAFITRSKGDNEVPDSTPWVRAHMQVVG